MSSRLRAALVVFMLLGGCSFAPPYERPDPAIPEQWPKGDAYPTSAADTNVPRLELHQMITDRRLLGLIERALVSNQDLKLAAANIAVVRGQYQIQHAQLLPRIDAAASVGIGERSKQSSSGGGNNGTVYQVGIGTTAFEIDFFGRLNSLSDAALQEYFATEAAARTTRIALISDVASVYLGIAANRSLLAIVRDTVTAAERNVVLTRARLEGGVAPRSDLRQAETLLAQAQADLARLTTVDAQGRNALRLLVGAQVAEAELTVSLESLDGALRTVPAGLDSSILLLRPDVQQAEHRLQAANARIGAARAAFFPRISLTAATGLASASLSNLFTVDAFAWSVQPSMLVPIFDAGANQANLDATLAQREAATARYQKSIQSAFREVADVLARRGTIDRQFDAQVRLVEAARDNLRLIEARYRQGIDSFLGTLVAQLTLYAARRSLVAAWLTREQNLIALYRALGQPALPPLPPNPGL